MREAPIDISAHTANGEVAITWRDEPPVRHRFRDLRCACPCAGCVDEWTGARLLDVSTVPDGIGITGMELVGRYAVRITFTDGHDTGLYSWDRLHGLAAGS